MTQATFHLPTPDATADLAHRLGARLTAGDCLLLEGDIGAGKSHFCRALILSRLEQPEDIPSPTFTLVQTYVVQGLEIWHADLYRLSALEEIEELGLSDAMQDALCLIEWPDRLGPLTPDGALTLHLKADSKDESARDLTLSWSDARWDTVLDGVMDD